MGRLSISIKSKYNDFTNREKRIADFLLDCQTSAPLTITKLAEACQSSEATIVRFAKKLGYNGYPELKIAIAKEEFTGASVNMSEEDSMLEIFSKVTDDILASFEKTKTTLTNELLHETVDAILQSEDIFIYAVGQSGNIANELCHKLFRLGFNAKAFSDSHYQAMSATQSTDKTLVFAISHSGRTIDVIESVMTAKERGAKIIVFTASPRSPLGELADIILSTKSDETNYRLLGLTSRFAQLAIIDTIYSYLILHNEKCNECAKGIEEVIVRKRVESKKRKSS
ncbi:MAG: MurR/RpiR family transcriptional regulator, partial [Bacilli bacterium]|nr:MurR/RpiR family transcriptional regulator [Bacilli bacterium]